MLKFIAKKCFYGVIVLLGVITTVFFLFNVLPGDPASIMLGQRANKEAVEAVHKNLGTDKPISIQYMHYLNDLAPISIHKTNPALRGNFDLMSTYKPPYDRSKVVTEESNLLET